MQCLLTLEMHLQSYQEPALVRACEAPGTMTAGNLAFSQDMMGPAATLPMHHGLPQGFDLASS